MRLVGDRELPMPGIERGLGIGGSGRATREDPLPVLAAGHLRAAQPAHGPQGEAGCKR